MFAAEVGDEVAVAAECVAAGAEQAAAEEDKGDDAGERELGDEVAAGGEEEGAGVVLCHGVDDGDGAEGALELGAEEAQREVGEAQAEGRGGAGIGLPVLVICVELMILAGEDRPGEDAGLEARRGRAKPLDPRFVGAGVLAGRGGVCRAGDEDRQRERNAATSAADAKPANPHRFAPTTMSADYPAARCG